MERWRDLKRMMGVTKLESAYAFVQVISAYAFVWTTQFIHNRIKGVKSAWCFIEGNPIIIIVRGQNTGRQQETRIIREHECKHRVKNQEVT